MIETIERKLNEIYEGYGYRKFKMSKFEPYDLYAQNRDFLKSGKIITFTDLNGSLLALKPDITLSIIKNNTGDEEKLYYNETVYRAQENAYKEIMQAGVECIGRIDAFGEAEVLGMAVRSLAAVAAQYSLNVSDAGFIQLLLDTMQPDGDARAELLRCIAAKNAAGIEALAEAGAITRGNAAGLVALMQLHLPLREGIEQARRLSPNREADRVLDALETLADILAAAGLEEHIYLDFSLVNSMDYYNGIIFQGYVEGIPFSVLSGGRYDRLAQKMGKKVGAIGFALYLDRIDAYLVRDKKYDAQCMLVYEADDDARGVAAVAEQLRKKGKSVRCIRREQLEGMKRVPRCEEICQYTELAAGDADEQPEDAGSSGAASSQGQAEGLQGRKFGEKGSVDMPQKKETEL